MFLIYLWVFGPALAGILVALAWWFVAGRGKGLPAGLAGVFTLVAGLLLVLGGLTQRLTGISPLLPVELPFDFLFWYTDFRFAVPLALGIFGLVVLAFP